MTENNHIFENFSSYAAIKNISNTFRFSKVIMIFLIFILIIPFLPWTQNFRSQGYVTSLNPSSRPQTIQSVIEGRIEKWYVSEGEKVKKGDTIVKLSDIKVEYFDTSLVNRVKQQIEAKRQSVESYQKKINALNDQINALIKFRDLKRNQLVIKLQQLKLKLESDSLEYLAAVENHKAAKKQYDRMVDLYQQGLKSLTDLENRKVKLAEAQSKEISAFNKYQTTLNEYKNTEIELKNLENEYAEKISKIESDKFSAISALFETENEIIKLQVNATNYSIRNKNYFVLAPQDCYIMKAAKQGIGEVVYPGDPLVNIAPIDYQIGVEMYVDPLDVNLLSKGSIIRIQFDGWPALVFSGWPKLSYGTYGGRVYSIDKFISPNGKFRVLVEPDTSGGVYWPENLYLGGGANCIALLKTVPLGYEVWRQINGFPPDFYINNPGYSQENAKNKKK